MFYSQIESTVATHILNPKWIDSFCPLSYDNFYSIFISMMKYLMAAIMLNIGLSVLLPIHTEKLRDLRASQNLLHLSSFR
jgi:hypothetical protein